MACFRKHLSAPGLIRAVHQSFLKIPDPKEFTRRTAISLKDHLMSGLAVFGLKCPSLLEYDRKRKNTAVAQNLRDLYLIDTPPCDTYLRERLDQLDPGYLRPAFKKIFSLFQKGKGLEDFEYMDGHVLISADGTGLFSSGRVSCSHCCVKQHRDGTTSYYHQMLGVCIVHPDKKNVIPLCPELILNKDGTAKNDCERNACKRFLENFRREHPHLKAILLEDGLGSTAPNIRMIEEHGLRYILGAKPGDHQYLFEHLESDPGTVYHEITTDDGHYHQFRFLNQVGINKSNPDLKVNAIEYRHTTPKGKETTFSWATNIRVTKTNALEIARAGRSRWKIENETFNTLKNLGYNLERNYGHGKQNLSTIFCMLMMLAFFIDQVQECCCELYRRCRRRAATYRNLWEEMRTLFKLLPLRSWATFYLIIAGDRFLDTS